MLLYLYTRPTEVILNLFHTRILYIVRTNKGRILCKYFLSNLTLKYMTFYSWKFFVKTEIVLHDASATRAKKIDQASMYCTLVNVCFLTILLWTELHNNKDSWNFLKTFSWQDLTMINRVVINFLPLMKIRSKLLHIFA